MRALVSLGSIEGAVAAAIEPNVKLWALNVGGSEIVEQVILGPAEGSQLSSAAFLNFGFTGDFLDFAHPLVTLVQTITEPADPISFAAFLVTSPGSIHGTPVPPRNILATEVLYDANNPNEGSEALARAAGLGLAVPNAGVNANVRTLAEVRNPTTVPDRLPLPDVSPDSSQRIHDTPVPGVTAVVVQASPGTHYDNLIRSTSTHYYAIPYGQGTSALDPSKQFSVRCSYVPATNGPGPAVRGSLEPSRRATVLTEQQA
jgi:hypothetical protein